ncbi:YfdX family protein [Rickettsiales endosymbiont of Stachyamoeba lipophora]|uniref:YfdX family protein n=1 Tax=Rickettsiales endosymbiont of Stachyamoeba lipophora TaxID=2486578 RepID=UPI000F6486BA|nr:YfdX family protein [Rickettsiales endosymbiont of Stachyamoeba lipophora]AZL15913.1 hypothetical protein EF513_05080 [Rickettsiales endosymbiont of Stachyamoeba lipophora]
MNPFTFKPIILIFKTLRVSWLSIILSISTSTPYLPQALSFADNFQTSQAQSEALARSEIEQQHEQAKEEARKTLVRDAIESLEETKKALTALNKGQENEALTAIEHATGKINILLARYPEKSILPIDFEVKLIDTAPVIIQNIKEISKDAEKLLGNKNYPEARLLLDILRSEINIRTYNLPLAMYPTALKEAARLLDQKKINESITELDVAIHTLVVVDQVLPLPIINAKLMLAMAEEKHEKDREAALKLMSSTRHELERARELGYAGKDEEYASLNKAIEALEKQAKSHKKSPFDFSIIKDQLKAFLKRLSESKKTISTQTKIK